MPDKSNDSKEDPKKEPHYAIEVHAHRPRGDVGRRRADRRARTKHHRNARPLPCNIVKEPVVVHEPVNGRVDVLDRGARVARGVGEHEGR